MTENTDNLNQAPGSVDMLSQRVTRVLEEDARRRRWITRTFVVLAIIPAVAAALVFMFGRSDVSLMQQEARNIEAQVADRVTASVANELKGVDEVRELLPELKAAAKAVPTVQENQRELSAYRSRMDSVLRQQDEWAQSIERTTSDLATRVNRAEGQIAQVEQINSSIDSIRSEVRNTRNELEAKVARVPAMSALARLSDDAARVTPKQISGINNRLAALERSRKGSEQVMVKEMRSIDQRLDRISKMIAGLDARLKRLEKSRLQVIRPQIIRPRTIE